jgi:hypothetical protein
MHSLAINPYAFPYTPPATQLRIAKTRSYQRGEYSIPALTFYFQIIEDDKVARIIDVVYKDSR